MKTKNIILVALFAALTAIGAFIKIPLPFVPFTMQFFFCAMAGILLGAKLGALSQIVYVVIGLIGVPVFTEGGGIGYIFKPTFGFLLGLIVAAFVIGFITEKAKKQTALIFTSAVFVGLLVLYFIGIPYLYLISNVYLHKAKSFYSIIGYFLATFLGGDILKSIACATLCKLIYPVIKQFKSH